MVAPLVPLIAKGVATYVGTEVLLDVSQRFMRGSLLDDLNSGKLIHDAVHSAKEMLSNPLDTSFEVIKNKVGMQIFQSVGTVGKAALIGADMIFSSDDKVAYQNSYKMKV